MILTPNENETRELVAWAMQVMALAKPSKPFYQPRNFKDVDVTLKVTDIDGAVSLLLLVQGETTDVVLPKGVNNDTPSLPN